MEINNREKGTIGEDIACDYLKENGYTIVKRNFHFGKIAELDIVAKKNDVIVFFEVKSRQSSNYGDPLFSITPSKQRGLRKAANAYLHFNKITDQECRFDVITIDVNTKPPAINHIENAF